MAVASRGEIFSFGEFRLDVNERRVWRGQALVSLPPKTFDLLTVMVQDAGRLLEKDYLIRAVWPDSYVQEANLSVHIANIRKALGHDPETAPLIETVPRAGYRFVAAVSRLGSIPVSSALECSLVPERANQYGEAAPVPQRNRGRQARHLVSAAAVLFASAMLVFLVMRAVGHEAGASASSVNTHPLISTPGLFLQPAFSPDGAELAYTWRSDTDRNQSIYVQAVADDHRTLLLDTGRDDYAPAWSPDGTRIAFLHTGSAPQTFDILVADRKKPALRSRLATVCDASDVFHGSPSLSWSPDGKTLVTTDCMDAKLAGLTLVSVEAGAKRRLTNAPLRAVDDQAVFSPAGDWIAFRRSTGDSSDDIYLVPTSGGSPRELTEESNPIDGLAWSADGKRILYSSARATSQGSIWSLPISGGKPVAVTTPLTHTSSPAVSPVGGRMAYVDAPNNVSVWRLALDGGQAAQPFISSNFFDSSAVYSPDGSKVAFRSDRSGANEIWLSRSDGSDPRRVTHFNGPMTGSPRWSPDGHALAFDSRAGGHAGIYVADIRTGQLTRLTGKAGTPGDNVVPKWSRDGASVFFSSDRTGSWQIWQHSLATGAEMQVTTRGGFNAEPSPDGQFLLYVGDMDRTEIRERSLADPREDVSLVSLGAGRWHSWTACERGLLYLQTSANPASSDLMRISLRGGRPERLASVSQAANDSVSLSPDQRFVLYARRSSMGSSIMVVDGWR